MVVTFIISLVVFLITSIANPIAAIDTKSHINVFNHQKQYIEAIEENKQDVLDIELAGLTKTKMELNGWLYEAQYYAEHYGFFCYYPDEILELKPIK